MQKVIKPYTDKDNSKKEQVEEMFDAISGKYDFLNRLLSMKIDVAWRKELVKKVKELHPKKILDVATGTGDLVIEQAKSTDAEELIGLDLSQKMLEVGILKVEKNGLSDKIKMIKGDAEHLPFSDHTFDVVTVSFGARNFENLAQGLQEMRRVLKTGGTLFILEFSQTEGFFAPFFNFYFKSVLPKIGSLISKDSRAYTYLPDSVEAFPYGENLKKIILQAGFAKVKYKKLTFGVATLYESVK